MFWPNSLPQYVGYRARNECSEEGETELDNKNHLESSAQPELRLMTLEQVQEQLQLQSTDVDWLVATRQMTKILINGQPRFVSTEVAALIQTYVQIAKRNHNDSATQ